MFWVIIAVVAVATVIPIVWPMLRARQAAATEARPDLDVYRQQLLELEREVADGEIEEKAAVDARREIERRILRAAGGSQPAPVSSTARPLTLLIALLLPSLATIVYLSLGSPDQSGLQGAVTETRGQLPPIGEATAQLAKRLEQQPDDLEGWLLLGRSYRSLERHAQAARAFGRALAIKGGDANIHVEYGQALVASADGMITAAAKAAFEQALKLEPGHPGARYYLGLNDLRDGRPQQAYDRWLALVRELPAGSRGRIAIIEQLQVVARQLAIDLKKDLPDYDKELSSAAERPRSGPDSDDVRAAGEMSAEERKAFISSMVGRLAQRLEESPDDFEGWLRLGRAYQVLARYDEAAEAYARAVSLRPRDTRALEGQAQALLSAAGDQAMAPQEALTVLRKLLEVQPDNVRALWFLGLDDARRGDHPAAIEKWERLVAQMQPGSPQYDSLQAGIAELKRKLTDGPKEPAARQ
jgi:cytochrome c-type biogenesis protein CcmH